MHVNLGYKETMKIKNIDVKLLNTLLNFYETSLYLHLFQDQKVQTNKIYLWNTLQEANVTKKLNFYAVLVNL